MAAPIPLNCTKCHESIKKPHNSVHALQHTWHKDCFSCSVCGTKLHQEFYSRRNTLYCRQHYLENYAHSCHKCYRMVTGLIMITGDVSFHPECFRCMKCRCVIGHGDNYVFVERSQLYCDGCYDADIGKYLKYKQFKTFHKGAIHQVHISPSKKRQFAFKCQDSRKENLLTGFHKKLKSPVERKGNNGVSVISCESDDSLQAGDVVLEINGIPITSNNIKQLSQLLETTDSSKRISVTIERIPHVNISNSSSIHDNNSTPKDDQRQEPNDGAITPDPEVYKRNMSYFEYDVFKRRTGKPSKIDRGMALGRFKSVKENNIDGLTDKDRQRLNRIQQSSGRNSATTDEPRTLGKKTRSKSLGDIQTYLVENDTFLIKKNFLTAESPLHRAQSFHVGPGVMHSQIFRPTDIEFGEVVGQGFYGEVIKVFHKVSGKVMVAKKLFDMDEEALEQFLKEIHVLKSLKHQNVLPFVGIMYKDTVLHLILEYIQGGTLRQLLKHKHVELPWEKKIQLTKDIAAGMAYLHNQHVMHRDLKSKNVLIKKKEGGYVAIVGDFGLARIMQETHYEGSSSNPRCNFKKRNTVVGSPYWMAPEMLHGELYDESADIFSYGIVMCEVISRLLADPELIPRTGDFGLDMVKFKEKIDKDCPHVFLQLTKECCSMSPTQRPPFYCCEKWLDALLTSLRFEIPLPDVIHFASDPKPLMLKSISASSKDKCKKLQTMTTSTTVTGNTLIVNNALPVITLSVDKAPIPANTSTVKKPLPLPKQPKIIQNKALPPNILTVNNAPIPANTLTVNNAPIPANTLTVNNAPITANTLTVNNAPITANTLTVKKPLPLPKQPKIIQYKALPSNSITVNKAPIPANTSTVSNAPIPANTLTVNKALIPANTSTVKKPLPLPKQPKIIQNQALPPNSLTVNNAPIPAKRLTVNNAPIPANRLTINNAPIPANTLTVNNAPIPVNRLTVNNAPIPANTSTIIKPLPLPKQPKTIQNNALPPNSLTVNNAPIPAKRLTVKNAPIPANNTSTVKKPVPLPKQPKIIQNKALPPNSVTVNNAPIPAKRLTVNNAPIPANNTSTVKKPVPLPKQPKIIQNKALPPNSSTVNNAPIPANILTFNNASIPANTLTVNNAPIPANTSIGKRPLPLPKQPKIIQNKALPSNTLTVNKCNNTIT